MGEIMNVTPTHIIVRDDVADIELAVLDLDILDFESEKQFRAEIADDSLDQVEVANDLYTKLENAGWHVAWNNPETVEFYNLNQMTDEEREHVLEVTR